MLIFTKHLYRVQESFMPSFVMLFEILQVYEKKVYLNSGLDLFLL